MPDHRMPDRNIPDDLDRRIRDLVARAVGDAPEPPDISGDDAIIEPTQLDRRRWWYGGGITAAAAAALIAVFILSADNEETTRPTSATQPPAVRTVPISPSAGTPAASIPGTVSPRTSLPTTVPETFGAQVLEAPAESILTAGPEGVVETIGRDRHRLTDEPMAIALATGDGRVLVQRQSGYSQDFGAEETVPQVMADDGSTSDLFGTADWDGHVTMHDVEVVDGRTTLLYSISTAMDVPTRADESLYVVDLATDDRTTVATGVGGWEAGTGRLHLTTTGLVVGEGASGATHGIVFYAVPGTPAADSALPTASDLGLDATYSDCTDCPHTFTVSPDGGLFAWFDGEERLVVHTLDGAYHETFTLPPSPVSDTGDLDIGGGTVLVSPPLGLGDPDYAPLSFDLADLSAPPTTLEGFVATLGPASTLPALTLPERTPQPTAPASTDPPTTTTPPTAPTMTTEPPASGGVDGIVAAGPGGVVAYDNGLSRTIIDEPMEMAIAIGDRSYLVQRKVDNAPGTEPADTEPLILSADGTLSPLWTDAEPRYYTMHDVEVVDGRRLVVFTVVADQPVNVESDLTAHIMVADLGRPGAAPTELGSVDTWEGGVSRLHLTTGGLVVGEMFAEASHSFVAYAVLGSPASDEPVPTAAGLGLDDYYTDCNDCPNTFTVSPHGTNVAWLIRTPGIDGHTELVMHPMNGDAERPFDPFATDVNTTLIDDVDLLADGAILLSYWDAEGSEPRPPVFIANDGTTTVLTGIIATANPTGR